MQSRGDPVSIQFDSTASGPCVIKNSDGSTITINPYQRLVMDSFTALFEAGTVGDGTTALILNPVNSTGTTIGVHKMNVSNLPASIPVTGSGGGGQWEAAPQNEGFAFQVGVTPYMRFLSITGTFHFSGTGYLQNVGGNTAPPSFVAPIS